MSGRGFIQEEPPQVCELCYQVAECRPYGPNDEQICFECGRRDPVTTNRKMCEYILGLKDE